MNARKIFRMFHNRNNEAIKRFERTKPTMNYARMCLVVRGMSGTATESSRSEKKVVHVGPALTRSHGRVWAACGTTFEGDRTCGTA